MRPHTEDARVTRLGPEEEGAARSMGKAPEDMIALPVVALPDTRRNVELARGSMGDVFLIPLVLQLPAGSFEFSRLIGQDGAPVRGPTDGMLPMLPSRLVIPRRNLTEQGWALVGESEQAAELQERARWGLMSWRPVPEAPAVSVLHYVTLDHPHVPRARQTRVASLVFGGSALMVAFTQTLDKGLLGVKTFTPEGEEDIAGLHARATVWALDNVRAWLANAPEGAQVARADA